MSIHQNPGPLTDTSRTSRSHRTGTCSSPSHVLASWRLFSWMRLCTPGVSRWLTRSHRRRTDTPRLPLAAGRGSSASGSSPWPGGWYGNRTGWWWHWPVRWPLWTLTYHCRTAGTRGTTPPDTAAVPWTRSTAWTRLRIAEHRVKVKSGSKFISLTFVYIYTCTSLPLPRRLMIQ